MTEVEIPAVGSARVHVLHDGYVGLDGDGERASGPVTLILDEGAVTVVDPHVIIPGHGASFRPGTPA